MNRSQREDPGDGTRTTHMIIAGSLASAVLVVFLSLSVLVIGRRKRERRARRDPRCSLDNESQRVWPPSTPRAFLMTSESEPGSPGYTIPTHAEALVLPTPLTSSTPTESRTVSISDVTPITPESTFKEAQDTMPVPQSRSLAPSLVSDANSISSRFPGLPWVDLAFNRVHATRPMFYTDSEGGSDHGSPSPPSSHQGSPDTCTCEL